MNLIWILIIILIILIGLAIINNNPNISGAAERYQLIAISSPTGSDKIPLRGKKINIKDYYRNDEFNEDKLVDDITRFIRSKDVILIGNIRSDQTRIKPDKHIHIIRGIDLTNINDPYICIAENKKIIQMRYNMDELDWNRYWDDLCHMDIHEFMT